MKNNFIDYRISNENKVQFKNDGWTLVNLKLSKESINNAIKGLREIKKSSIYADYKPRRIYYDHLISNNLAAIELPFNKEICNENVRNFFKEAKIGSLVKELMDWDYPCCDLARLFCMSKFKYRGNWHRDYLSDLEKIQFSSLKRDFILVGLYLLPQKGFRILKKEFEYNGKKTIIPNKKVDSAIRSFPFPLKPKKEAYYEIDGKIGTALFFDPLLMHQGSSYCERLDFHLKFHNSNNSALNKNNFQDFSVSDILHENYNFEFNGESSNDSKCSSIPFNKRSNIVQRITNSIDYRICLRNVLKIRNLKANKNYNYLYKNEWQLDYFSNTLFQE